MKITCGPYLQNAAADSITVMWHTPEPADSTVEYELAGQPGEYAYSPKETPGYPERKNFSSPSLVHLIRLDGLSPGRRYFYRVLSEGPGGIRAESEGLSFRTAPGYDSPFRFVSYGDCLRIPEAHRRNALFAHGMRPDICVSAGDMAQDVIETFQDRFFEPAEKLLSRSPWYTSMGNHDSPNEGFFRYFSLPGPGYWYSFDYGCAHFCVMNTCMDYRPGSEQWIWFENDLNRHAGARWKFVIFHHPPYCSSSCEIVGARVLCPLFEKYNVDFVYNAHATRYERSHPLRGGKYDSTNGTVYIVSGGGGYDMRLPPSNHWQHIHPTAAMVMSRNHTVHTAVAPDEVAIKAFDENGMMFDTCSYVKRPEKIIEPAAPSGPACPPRRRSPSVLAGMEEKDVNWVLPRPQFSPDRDVSFGGGASIRWECASPAPVTPAIRRAVVGQGKAKIRAAGKRYIVRAMVKTSLNGPGATVGFEWSGDMGFLGRVDSQPVSGETGWGEVRVETPPMPDYVYWCRVQLSAAPGTAGLAWFDMVSVDEI